MIPFKLNRSVGMLFILSILFQISLPAHSQEHKSPINEDTFSGFKLRNIGPAFMSGRIADIAVHPNKPHCWYVAVGSGGVWKTENAGTTWTPLFDKQSVYSTGCITIDQENPNIIWVGTGENVGGRHVGFGDGIYRSNDGGETWKNVGLKESQHISKIIIHPNNSNIIWAAVQGPLWNKGGDRGLYKSIDNGKNWRNVLGDNEWTGVTDLVIDPRNPDRMYAATWQRHRNVASYMGGGPNTAIYRSEDGGENWSKLSNGLPKSNMGKIGLTISPQKPDIIYAAIELDRTKGGIFRSDNRGEKWVKMSDAVSGATGPHYYQELYASPHKFDQLYLMDVRIQISKDGGKTFTQLKEQHKHSDNHSIAFSKTNPDYLLIGTDGGIYESFDGAKNWRFIDNLPITQYYKLAVDDSKPFYNIYGGTQDNNTQGGPSRTDNVHGIRNADWYITLFADGHQPATEPGNPDIIYCEWQEGNLNRIDKSTGEIIHIQPQPRAGEPTERFNWDAPILVSPHSATRLYFASQRLWRSEDRGDSWLPISGDLTKNLNRIQLPIMGATQSWDNAWDFNAMSNYNTITSISESSVQEDLIYIGTDDGLIQMTEDGGKNWTKIEISSIPNVPATAFINDIKADLFDANTLYIALDNHKFGDLKPLILKSTNRGKSWILISSSLPQKTIVWRLVQDHVNPNLIFAGTEFGLYFTIDGGGKWIKLKGNVPTISFRDLAIQRRENDLIGASFGRGFFIFDDYTPLRNITEEQLKQEALLFTPRDAQWYIPRPVLAMGGKGSQGASHYIAPNPDFGANLTYYLANDINSLKKDRKRKEKELLKTQKNIKVANWQDVEDETLQEDPKIVLTISDDEGNAIRRLNGKTSKGFHRLAWDLRYAPTTAILRKESKVSDNFRTPKGRLVTPGTYYVGLSKEENGVISKLSEKLAFKVIKMRDGALSTDKIENISAFWEKASKIQGKLSAINLIMKNLGTKLKVLKKSINNSPTLPGLFDKRLHEIRKQYLTLDHKLNGPKAQREIGEKPKTPTINSRLMTVIVGISYSTYGPTKTHRQSLNHIESELKIIQNQITKLVNQDLPAFERQLLKAGAPWGEGMSISE